MRLGVDLGLFPGADRALVDELFIITQPAHLQKQHSRRSCAAEERDLLRADMLRERLRATSSRPTSRCRCQDCNGSQRAGQTANESTALLELALDIMSDEAMNNFTPRAQQVLALARKEADRFNHNFVGTEHCCSA